MKRWKLPPTGTVLAGDLVLTVLAGVGTPLLAANCLRALQKMLPMTFCTVYVVGPDGRIQTVSAASAYGTSAERTAALYVDRRYDRCDPHMLWLAGRKLPVQAQLWLGHHQGDELMDAEYRAACYDSVGIRERASVLQLSPSGERTAVSFYRSFAQPEFDRDDFAVMGQHAAFLAEAVSAHRRSRTPRTESGSSSLDSRMLSLSLRERLFVEVARLNGQNDFEIIIFQILPNLTAYLAASFVGAVSGGILASVGLEVLGLGPQNIPTIGRTLYYAFNYSALFKGMWWWWGPPIVTLAIIFTGLFLMSMSLDKYANPRLRGSTRG